MIRQTGGHGWSAGRAPDAIGSLSPERPDRPAEVVAIGNEIGRRLMDVPILGESVSPPDFASILRPVRAVVPLHKGEVDVAAARRTPQGLLQILPASLDDSRADAYDPAPAAVFVDRRVQQSGRRTTARLGSAADPMLAAARIGLSVDLQDRFTVGLVFVAGDPTHPPASRATVEVPHETMDIPAGPLARHQGNDQLVLGIQGHRVPVVPAPLIRRVVRITLFFLFAHEGPLFVELNLLGLRGKGRPDRRAIGARARRPAR